MALVLGVTGLVVHRIFRSDLNATIDSSLQSRSDAVAGFVRQTDDGLESALRSVSGDEEDFAQVLRPGGRLVASTPQVQDQPLLAGAALARAARASATFDHAPVRQLEGALRLRTVPVDTPRGRAVVVVGTAFEERDASLRALARLLTIGGAIALLLASIAGYAVAAGALRPVEAMRRRAAAISPAGSGQRLPVPRSRDEIARLGTTLNAMLDRLEAAFARERKFTDDASHELRTPLGILKTELELALHRGRSVEELRAALESAAAETNRVIALAEDLLVIARLDEGRLSIRATELEGRELLAAVAARFEVRARERGRSVRATAGDAIRLHGDRVRLEQALGNLVDNALRHGAGEVRLSAVARNTTVELRVADDGPGFAAGFIDQAFERFSRADGARSRGGTGLGLAIVAAVAASHGGRARAVNRADGGAEVSIDLPVSLGSRDDAPRASVLRE